MMETSDTHGLILSSGRCIPVDRVSLTIDGDVEHDLLYDGYDGFTTFRNRQYPDEAWVEAPLTESERREIAEHMIARWRLWGGVE